MAFLPQGQQAANYGGGAVLSEKLEIFISCRNLPKMDINSPSDPFVVISQRNEKTAQFVELVKTEIVMDNNDPEFSKQIHVCWLSVLSVILTAFNAIDEWSRLIIISKRFKFCGSMSTTQIPKISISSPTTITLDDVRYRYIFRYII